MSTLDNGNFRAAGSSFKDAVCVECDRIYDSCSDKDCLEDLQVFFTDEDQAIVDNAICVKAKSAELISCNLDVEAVAFNKGFFSVDITYFFSCKFLVTNSSTPRPVCLTGLCIYCKKVILFGSESNSKTFSSDDSIASPEVEEDTCNTGCETTLPSAVINVTNPIVLGSKLVDESRCHCEKSLCIPDNISRSFGGTFLTQTPNKIVYCSLGIFSIVSLVRKVQMLIPVYDFCIPTKECVSTTDDPCDVFRRIKFPTDDFFPPKLDACEDNLFSDSCGCGN